MKSVEERLQILEGKIKHAVEKGNEEQKRLNSLIDKIIQLVDLIDRR